MKAGCSEQIQLSIVLMCSFTFMPFTPYQEQQLNHSPVQKLRSGIDICNGQGEEELQPIKNFTERVNNFVVYRWSMSRLHSFASLRRMKLVQEEAKPSIFQQQLSVHSSNKVVQQRLLSKVIVSKKSNDALLKRSMNDQMARRYRL